MEYPQVSSFFNNYTDFIRSLQLTFDTRDTISSPTEPNLKVHDNQRGHFGMEEDLVYRSKTVTTNSLNTLDLTSWF